MPIQQLPLGIFAPPGGTPRAGVAIGDSILDLAAAAPWLPEACRAALSLPTLNALLARPAGSTTSLSHVRRAPPPSLPYLLDADDERTGALAVTLEAGYRPR